VLRPLANRSALRAAFGHGLRPLVQESTGKQHARHPCRSLEIKSERVTNADKLRNVRAELAALSQARDESMFDGEVLAALTAELKGINESLWQIEDEIRLCERAGDFGPRFVELARSVYEQNDRRAGVKRRINERLGSETMEEKSHAAGDQLRGDRLS
jgi:hypothetical protein